jgi:outer membrane lipoprotein SlyB
MKTLRKVIALAVFSTAASAGPYDMPRQELSGPTPLYPPQAAPDYRQPAPAYTQGAPSSAPLAAPACPNCGVVQAVRVVKQRGRGTGVGMIGGGVVGALVGSQFGHGSTNTLATVGGAAGGAYLGNEVEKKVKSTTRYNVVVRMDNGRTKTFSYAQRPGFSAGNHVRVENGTLVQSG